MMIQASKRYGRVRRDNVEEPYWKVRFMIARRVETDERSDRSSDRRRAAVRALERLAGALFKRPRDN